jgi:hypothetical protein
MKIDNTYCVPPGIDLQNPKKIKKWVKLRQTNINLMKIEICNHFFFLHSLVILIFVTGEGEQLSTSITVNVERECEQAKKKLQQQPLTGGIFMGADFF